MTLNIIHFFVDNRLTKIIFLEKEYDRNKGL